MAAVSTPRRPSVFFGREYYLGRLAELLAKLKG